MQIWPHLVQEELDPYRLSEANLRRTGRTSSLPTYLKSVHVGANLTQGPHLVRKNWTNIVSPDLISGLTSGAESRAKSPDRSVTTEREFSADVGLIAAVDDDADVADVGVSIVVSVVDNDVVADGVIVGVIFAGDVASDNAVAAVSGNAADGTAVAADGTADAADGTADATVEAEAKSAALSVIRERKSS